MNVIATFSVTPYRNMAENVSWIFTPTGEKRVIPNGEHVAVVISGSIEKVNQVLQKSRYTLTKIEELNDELVPNTTNP